MSYDEPTITELGSVRDFTLEGAGFGNKVGRQSDIYSKSVPLVGSIIPS